MTTQHFDIFIHAPPRQVWATMLQSPTYERWTAAFCEGSRFEGSWDEGQTMRFLGPDGLGIFKLFLKSSKENLPSASSAIAGKSAVL